MTPSRTAFIDALQAATPPLRRVEIRGFPHPVWLRRMTVGEARALVAAAKAQAGDDPFANARTVASLVRDDTGALLFDRHDDAQLKALQAALESTDARVMNDLMQQIARLNDADETEVDHAGN